MQKIATLDFDINNTFYQHCIKSEINNDKLKGFTYEKPL